jgi:hypothetical protein
VLVATALAALILAQVLQRALKPRPAPQASHEPRGASHASAVPGGCYAVSPAGPRSRLAIIATPLPVFAPTECRTSRDHDVFKTNEVGGETGATRTRTRREAAATCKQTQTRHVLETETDGNGSARPVRARSRRAARRAARLAASVQPTTTEIDATRDKRREQKEHPLKEEQNEGNFSQAHINNSTVAMAKAARSPSTDLVDSPPSAVEGARVHPHTFSPPPRSSGDGVDSIGSTTWACVMPE